MQVAALEGVLATRTGAQEKTLVNPSQFEVCLHTRQRQIPFKQPCKADAQTEDPFTKGEPKKSNWQQDGAFLSV